MRKPRLRDALRRLGALPNEHPAKTLLVAGSVALVCAALVSTTAILLRPRQQANREQDRRAHIDRLVARLPGIEVLFPPGRPRDVEARVIELATGAVVRSLDPAVYDMRKAALDPQMSIALHAQDDLAGIQRRARYATVHLIREGDAIRLVILPVHGSGYDSTLHGFVALEGDANTVVALSFFDHEETPGLGAEIDNPAWLAQWRGRRVHDEQGRLRIGVAPGRVVPGGPDAPFQVDGITGATRTGEGVQNLLRFWLGEHGFGPFLAALRREGGS